MSNNYYAWWKSQPVSRRIASALLILTAVIWPILFFFSITLHFIAYDFLYALAWKYSAFFTIPLGIYWAIWAWNSMEFRKKLGKRFWFSALLPPPIAYFIIGLSILKIPASLLYFTPIVPSMETVTYEGKPGWCHQGSFATREYPSFLQACVFLSGENSMLLKPGDKIQLEGKKGMGGFLVERYISYRKAGAANNSLQPTGYAGG